jgi:acyl-CoA thioester hydrolase
MRTDPRNRSEYRHFHAITTRWMDNDVYGHVNNVVYYSWFDTAVNQYLVANGGLDIEHSPVIGLVIETQCNYFAPVAFPDRIVAGIAVARLGTTAGAFRACLCRPRHAQAACLAGQAACTVTLHPDLTRKSS